MIIIFDFDFTLFSSKKFFQALQKEFWKWGVSESLFKGTFQASKLRGKYYRPLRQIELIFKKNSRVSRERLKQSLERVLGMADRFLYPDVSAFLERTKKFHQFFIVSCGEKNFQKQKINCSGIEKYFRKVFITQADHKTFSLKKILKDGSNGIFIDDIPLNLSMAKKTFPKLITVRIKRRNGQHAEEKDNLNIDFSIKNLIELERIIKEHLKNQ